MSPPNAIGGYGSVELQCAQCELFTTFRKFSHLAMLVQLCRRHSLRPRCHREDDLVSGSGCSGPTTAKVPNRDGSEPLFYEPGNLFDLCIREMKCSTCGMCM